MIEFLTSAGFGAFVKVASFVFTNYLEDKRNEKDQLHNERMAVLNRPPDRLQPGFDTAQPGTAWTRRVLALGIAIVFGAFFLYATINPEQSFTILVPKDGGIFAWLFGGVGETERTATLGMYLDDCLLIVSMIFGFYFTPVGKSLKQ